MHTRHRLIISLVVLVLGLWFLWALTNNPRLIPIKVGDELFTVEVVSSYSDRSKGLSGRDELADKTGMLFVFDTPGIYPFWMKDMEFPIDIAWIDNDWCVVNVAYNATPETYPDSYVPTNKALYVLEVDARVLESKNIGVSYCFEPPRI